MSHYSANQRMVTPRPGGPIGTVNVPDWAGPEADAEFRAGLVAVAGRPSVEPLTATLASLISSWFGPITIAEDGTLRGHLGRDAVRVDAAIVLDLLRRSDLSGQLGPIDAATVAAALPLVARHAHAEAERQVVADEARADDDHRERVRDADLAQRRAELLRALAELDAAPAPVVVARPVPAPPKAMWCKKS